MDKDNRDVPYGTYFDDEGDFFYIQNDKGTFFRVVVLANDANSRPSSLAS